MTSTKSDKIIARAVELGFSKSDNMATGTRLRLRKFDARKLCEFSISVMRHSVPESRADRPPLYVGAVIYLPDGSVEFAYRGELRDGEHGEFTLLERKLRHVNLEGSVLFTTLEPCLNRNPPKRGCARHIVSARIKEIYVGIEDDNPAVKGRGIEHLRLRGQTEIHMFDEDLQEVILKENQAFFEWARLQDDKPPEAPIKLSDYEDSVPAVQLSDLSAEALNLYRDRAGIPWPVESPEFRRMLLKQRVLVEDGNSNVPTGFGLLLFGNDPSLSMEQAKLMARAELPDGRSARREFAGPLVLVPREIQTWLTTVLPSTIDRSQMERQEHVDLPFEMIREAVVNALIHRDYDLDGQKCHLLVTPDSITIKSPGGPTPPITLQQMQSFSAPIKSRNPLLHHVFSRIGFAEEQGYGLSSLKKRSEELGLPLPHFSWQDPYLVLTIYRSGKSATKLLPDNLLSQLSESQKRGWEWLSKRSRSTKSEYAEAMGIGDRTATTHLSHFKHLGLLSAEGSGPATVYVVNP